MNWRLWIIRATTWILLLGAGGGVGYLSGRRPPSPIPPGPDEPAIQIEAPAKADCCDLLAVSIKGRATEVVWDWEGEGTKLARQSDSELVLLARRKGVLRIYAVGIADGKPVLARRSVEVGGGVDPPPPPPVDPLTKSFQTAYDAETDPQKPLLVRQLVEVLRAAASLVNSATSTGQLTRAVRDTADAKLGAGKLAGVRSAVGVYLNRLFGDDDVALTPELKRRVGSEYAKVADALEGVRP